VDVWTGIAQNQMNNPNKIPQLQEIIDYWSDPSYVAAIDATGDLIDGWWNGSPWPKSTDNVFLKTLHHEAKFWVSVDSLGAD
jgi:thiaminase